jgi:hypothetical protein
MDKFNDHIPGLESPASHALAVSPSDTEDLPVAGRAVNAATAGSLRVSTVNGDIATITIAAGIAFPIRVKRIWASGTTATGLVVLY